MNFLAARCLLFYYLSFLSLVILNFSVFVPNTLAQPLKVFNSQGEETTYSALIQHASQVQQVILGERHDTPYVQNMEAQIIRDLKLDLSAPQKNSQKNLVAWEFLNVSENSKTLPAHQAWCEGSGSDQDLLSILRVGPTYLPVLKQACNDFKKPTKLIATNLTREEKAPALTGGLEAVDPKLVPEGFELGGANYWQRFLEVMQGHAGLDKIKNYFVAQSLVDDVMAYQVMMHSLAGEFQKQFIIAGHFHTDYYDGLVKRLQVRLPDVSKTLVTITDSEEMPEARLREFLNSPSFGPVSDYVIWFDLR